jgi:soluble lytic murein transglycosylase-like protein
MRRLRNILLAVAIGAALTASSAVAEDSSEALSAGSEAPSQPASETAAPAPTPAAPVSPGPAVKQGDSLAAPDAKPKPSGGTKAGRSAKPPKTEPTPSAEADGATKAPAVPSEVFAIPSIPSSGCASYGVPPILIPIYQRAAAAYGLGPQGASVLAGINEVETAFGTNLNVSSAGAVGWMQFMPSTWDMYGVDANGDGVADPYNPEDAIFAAARYLSAAGMPTDTYDAIFAYNHADWYVAEVLANAACYGGIGGVNSSFSLRPQLQELSCTLAAAWREEVPDNYLRAFEDAAARYGLGQRGVWALSAIARLESDFGRGMTDSELAEAGPLGLDPTEWDSYAVDGNEDGRIARASVADSAATMARLVWSRSDLRAGLFTHNQAAWYVQAVLDQAEALEGKCTSTPIEWNLTLPNTVIAPIDWANLTLSNELELRDLTSGAIDPRIVGLIGAITQDHQLTISALRSDHSQLTVEGNVSNHFFGRAMDIAAVDGVACTDTAPTAPCAELATTLAYLPAPAHPTELIYCFDVDGAGPAFARSDHCDHVHAGYDG